MRFIPRIFVADVGGLANSVSSAVRLDPKYIPSVVDGKTLLPVYLKSETNKLEDIENVAEKYLIEIKTLFNNFNTNNLSEFNTKLYNNILADLSTIDAYRGDGTDNMSAFLSYNSIIGSYGSSAGFLAKEIPTYIAEFSNHILTYIRTYGLNYKTVDVINGDVLIDRGNTFIRRGMDWVKFFGTNGYHSARRGTLVNIFDVLSKSHADIKGFHIQNSISASHFNKVYADTLEMSSIINRNRRNIEKLKRDYISFRESTTTLMMLNLTKHHPDYSKRPSNYMPGKDQLENDVSKFPEDVQLVSRSILKKGFGDIYVRYKSDVEPFVGNFPTNTLVYTYNSNFSKVANLSYEIFVLELNIRDRIQSVSVSNNLFINFVSVSVNQMKSEHSIRGYLLRGGPLDEDSLYRFRTVSKSKAKYEGLLAVYEDKLEKVNKDIADSKTDYKYLGEELLDADESEKNIIKNKINMKLKGISILKEKRHSIKRKIKNYERTIRSIK